MVSRNKTDVYPGLKIITPEPRSPHLRRLKLGQNSEKGQNISLRNRFPIESPLLPKVYAFIQVDTLFCKIQFLSKPHTLHYMY